MTETSGSTVPRRQIGRYLRELHDQSGMTMKAVAEAMELSTQTIWRMENGRPCKLRITDVERLCELYGAPAEMTEVMKGLAQAAKAKGWWHAYGDVIPETFDLYVGLEEAASHLTTYESELVPGLLQTEDYARAVTAAAPNLDANEVERRVEVRMQRQVLLRRPKPPKIDVVINQSVLERTIGGRKVMALQLIKLAEVSRLPNISVRVVPFSVGFHRGASSGPFVILEFPTGGQLPESPVVYCEGFTGALYLERPDELERYHRTYADIQGVALSKEDTMSLLRRAAKEMGK